ncbi:hypothetical protein LGI24_001884 [Salmonella enterica]|nr:hypothetical protein [Salmonella enterica]
MTERYDFQNCFPRGHKSARLPRQPYAALNLIGGNEKTLNSRRNTLIYFVVMSGIQAQLEDMTEGYGRVIIDVYAQKKHQFTSCFLFVSLVNMSLLIVISG